MTDSRCTITSQACPQCRSIKRTQCSKQRRSNVGAGLPAKTSAQQTVMLTDPTLSRASPLPQGISGDD
ncbi:hypothetical protein E1K68_06450 [Pseudomonas sp. B2021]|nr:hypothetical protein [Pseudomonas sp. B2021]